jgi:hypothetical protein
MNSRVFYAWQSDAPASVNRSLIRKAVESAIKRIAADTAIEDAPRLDQNTKGVAGTPQIAETILEKIRGCSAFVGDVTLVGSVDSAGASADSKRTPNPNVLIELGYAAAAVGWERTILVMNTAYGLPDDLPFDLRHRRWPIRFSAKPADTFDSVRSKLSAKIENALRLILPLGSSADTTAEPDDARQEKDRFHAAVKAGEFTTVDASRGVLALSIVPTSRPKDFSAFLLAISRSWSKLDPFRSGSFDRKLGGRVLKTFTLSGAEDASLTEVSGAGTTLAVTNRIFTGPSSTKSIQPVHWAVISDMPVERATRYLNVLREAGLRGPCWLTVALLNLQPSRIDGFLSGDPQVCEGDIIPDAAQFEISDVAIAFDDVARAVRPVLDHLWREFEQVNCPLFDASGTWKGVR